MYLSPSDRVTPSYPSFSNLFLIIHLWAILPDPLENLLRDRKLQDVIVTIHWELRDAEGLRLALTSIA